MFNKLRKTKKVKQRAKEQNPRPNRGVGPTLISPDTVIEGSIASNGEIQISGTIRGDVRASAIVIDAEGTVHGELFAEEIVVRGRVFGPISGKNVHVRAGAHVEGEISHDRISVESGAFIAGNVQHTGEGAGHPGARASALAGGDFGQVEDLRAYSMNEHEAFTPAAPGESRIKSVG